MRLRPLFIASAAIALASIMPATAASAGTAAPRHNITCKWTQYYGTPTKITATAISGSVRVQCSDNLDNSNTQALLQIYGGGYKDFGNAVTSYSTSTTIVVTDTAGARAGTWPYRTKGTHFGQHGNIFALPVYYSDSRVLTR